MIKKFSLVYIAGKNGVKKMQQKIRMPFTKLTFENWQNLIILSIIVFYSVWLSFAVSKDTIQSGFSGDYLAFWSAGKIADEKGYSQIYNLENLRSVQLKELDKLGLQEKLDASSYSPLPVALFPVFVFPFQILSKINVQPSYWIWTIINSIVLIGYLIYFTMKILPGNPDKMREMKLVLLMLISYPVWMNFVEGQVEIPLVICAGEFIRQAIEEKPVLSGLWLGGLLLKPQLLILIIPILLLMHSWKALSGFILSSSIVVMTSFLLSGFAGMKAMVDLWTRYSAGMATSAPEMMINWRMVGLNINSVFGTSLGWVIAGLGMLLTLVLVCILIKGKPSFGSSTWIITMAAVFSATLAVTWHSHHHMAVVLIPFLIYAYQFKLISTKIIFAWATTTAVFFLIFLVITIFVLTITKITIPGLAYLVAISGFFLNLLIFNSSLRYLHSKQKFPEAPFVNNPIS